MAAERSPSAAKERAEADVYDILVTLAGAADDESSRSQFHAFWPKRNDLREYRFCGELGFGGKFRCDSRGAAWRVDFYPEDSTYHRKEIVQDTNSGLATLEAECVAADRLSDPGCEEFVCGQSCQCGCAEGLTIRVRPVSAAVSPAEPPEAKRALTEYEKGYLDGVLAYSYRSGRDGEVFVGKDRLRTYESAALMFLKSRGIEGWKVNVR